MKIMQTRTATEGDIKACSVIIYEAFKQFSDKVGLSPEFGSPEEAEGLVTEFVTTPDRSYAVVALSAEGVLIPNSQFFCGDKINPSAYATSFFTPPNIKPGQVVGVNFLDCGDDVAAVGPIAVNPAFQGRGVGRTLMNDVVKEGHRRGKKLRLTQVSSNLSSMSLYLSMGFRIVEPLLAFTGVIKGDAARVAEEAQVQLREMTVEDVESCDQLHKKVAGVSRRSNITVGVTSGYAEANSVPPMVALTLCDSPRIVGFTTGLFIDGVTIAETTTIAQALLAHASSLDQSPNGLKFHVMARKDPELITWALSMGFKIAEQSNLMVLGDEDYLSPTSVYLPSVSY